MTPSPCWCSRAQRSSLGLGRPWPWSPRPRLALSLTGCVSKEHPELPTLASTTNIMVTREQRSGTDGTCSKALLSSGLAGGQERSEGRMQSRLTLE